MKHWCRYRSTCACIASTTAGRLWPRFAQPSPPAKSTYSRPSASQIARALGALDDERRRGDPARDVALAGFLDALGCAFLLQRHDVPTLYSEFGRRKCAVRMTQASLPRNAQVGHETGEHRLPIVRAEHRARVDRRGHELGESESSFLPRFWVTLKLLPRRLCAVDPDERRARDVLLVARGLPDEHHLGGELPFSEDGLRRVRVERAPSQCLHRRAKRAHRQPVGHERGRGRIRVARRHGREVPASARYDAALRGALAEWLGRGLQSLVQQFESARRLFEESLDLPLNTERA